MGFTRSTTDISVHQKLDDYPNRDDGLTPEEIKKRYDYPAETLQKDLNNLEAELENENASNKIGAIKIDDSDESENNIFAKLKMLSGRIREAVLSQIPDGTITKNKLLPEYEVSLARKYNLGKIYLASQYRVPKIETEIPQDFNVPKLTVDSHEGYEAWWGYNWKSNTLNGPYEMFGGDGNSFISSSNEKSSEVSVTLKLPYYFKIENLSFKARRANVTIYGSNDNENYNEITEFSVTDGSNDVNVAKTISTNTYYKYIKIYIYWESSRIYNNIQMSGKKIDSLDTNTMVLNAGEENEILDSYIDGQVLKLKTPDNYIDATTINSTINVYDLGAKSIPNDLQAGKRYSLVYDGQKFIHESEVE